MIIAALVLAYVACGVLTYGAAYGYSQNKWPTLANKDKNIDKTSAILLSLMGPIAAIATLFSSEFYRYGFKFG